jgi:hypothetical protein
MKVKTQERLTIATIEKKLKNSRIEEEERSWRRDGKW